MPLRPEPVEHRQTGYVPSPILDPPDALPPAAVDMRLRRRQAASVGVRDVFRAGCAERR